MSLTLLGKLSIHSLAIAVSLHIGGHTSRTSHKKSLEKSIIFQRLTIISFPIFYTFILLVIITQLCSALCDPMDYSPPGPSVVGILQARILEWVAIPFSRGSSQPTDQTWLSSISGRFYCLSYQGSQLY